MGLFKTRTRHILNVDVGSASIGVELLEISDGDLKRVVTLRKQIEFSKTLNYNKFLKDTEKAVRNVFEALIRKTRIRPDVVHCYLASPWFVSERREINYRESGKDFDVKQSLIDDLTEQEVEQLTDKAQKEYGGKIGKDPDVLEVKVVDIRLNGYSTNKPANKMASQLDIVLFVSVFPVKFRDMMKSLVSSNLNTDDIKFHSLPCAAMCALRETKDAPDDFTILDINGEITDVVIVKNGSIYEIVSFPLGRNFFWRELSKKMDTNLDETINTYDLYVKKQIHGTINDKIQKFIAEISDLWVITFLESIQKSDYEFYLPGGAYLLTDRVLYDFFDKSLKSEKLFSLGCTGKPFTVINSKENSTDWDKQGEDSFLSLERIFLKRIYDIK